MLFKGNFEKVVDSIDWEYLETMMLKMNFPTLWQKWIMNCVTRASVLVNKTPVDEFKFKRELRQGDLISPIFYLLVVKGINVLLQKKKRH